MNLSLYMFKEDGEPKAFQIDPGKTIIGRREDCDLRIPLGQISRKHALLTLGDEGAILRDLGSINGTYINNKRVSEQKLEAGDHIVIGPVVFTVQIDGKPSNIRQVRTKLQTRLPDGDEATPVQQTLPQGGEKEPFDLGAGQDEDDPISALEALASSDETKEIDLDDSSYSNLDNLDDSHI